MEIFFFCCDCTYFSQKGIGSKWYFLIEKVRFSIQILFFSGITGKCWTMEAFLLQNLLQIASLKMFG